MAKPVTPPFTSESRLERFPPLLAVALSLMQAPHTPLHFSCFSKHLVLKAGERGDWMAEGTLEPLVCVASPTGLGVPSAPFLTRQNYNSHGLVSQTPWASFRRHGRILVFATFT